MKDWRGRGQPPDPTKLALGLGMAAGVLVLCWIVFARSGDEKISSNGFSEGGAGGGSALFASERRSQTGLAMVHLGLSAAPSAARTEALPGGAPGAAPEPGPVAGAPAQAAATPPDPRELAAAGVPTDAAGLKRLGAEKGMLSAVVGRLLDHPRVLAAIFNNKLVVDAVMDRDVSRRNCADSGALAGVLSSPNSGPAAKMMPLVSNVLSHPDAAAAFAGSELGNRLLSCPSVQGLAHNQNALASIALANPQAVMMLSDPSLPAALASNPQGAALLGDVQSGLGGASSGGASSP